MTPNSKAEAWIRAASFFLWALVAVNVVSIFGYATFSLNPELLGRYPWAAGVFGYSYALFARVQIVVAFLCLVCALQGHVGLRWVPALVAIWGLSWLAETVGVAFGFPFGPYEYTDLLGPRLYGVPLLIPISWFFMAVVCYRIATHLEGDRSSAWWRVGVAAWLLSAWDLTLDPAMSNLSPFWVWGVEGSYYGSPLINLFGWFVTGLGLMLYFEWARARRWLDRLPTRFAYLFYAANLMLPVGLVIASKMWGPIGISLGSFGLVALAARYRTPTLWRVSEGPTTRTPA